VRCRSSVSCRVAGLIVIGSSPGSEAGPPVQDQRSSAALVSASAISTACAGVMIAPVSGQAWNSSSARPSMRRTNTVQVPPPTRGDAELRWRVGSSHRGAGGSPVSPPGDPAWWVLVQRGEHHQSMPAADPVDADEVVGQLVDAWACQSSGGRPHRGAGLTGHPLAVAGRAVALLRCSLRLLGKPARPWVLWPSSTQEFRERATDHTETLIAIASDTS
jgi:hypothetical protein